MHFRIRGLPAEEFSHLFALSDQELARYHAVRQIADKGYPCRVSLSDAEPGDELVLINYEQLQLYQILILTVKNNCF